MTKKSKDEILELLVSQVKEIFHGAEGGHDWWHTKRVWNTARLIAASEPKADEWVISLAALLHDVADAKFHDGDEEVGPRKARQILEGAGVERVVIDHTVNIVRFMSYKNSLEAPVFDSLEMRIVQDADRLDAMGAIGIARAFNYGGYKGRPLYDPEVPPNLDMTKEEYKLRAGPTVNHFYEKLLRLKDKMKTRMGRLLAEERHDFLEVFLHHFFMEWQGADRGDRTPHYDPMGKKRNLQ